jgi:hypothetical protein
MAQPFMAAPGLPPRHCGENVSATFTFAASVGAKSGSEGESVWNFKTDPRWQHRDEVVGVLKRT